MKLFLLMMMAILPAGADTFTYWVEPCTSEEAECEPADLELAEWAMQHWEQASAGRIQFERSPLSKARLRLYWAQSGSQGLYGEARVIEVDGRPGAEVHVRPSLHALGHKVEGVGSKDRLFRHTIVYLTCLHEIGHALGLEHTRSFTDIMYSFEYGGNILEYFGRFRRGLRAREDIRTKSGLSVEDRKRVRLLYAEKPRHAPVSAESSSTHP